MGESDQQKEAKRVQGELGGYINKIGRTNTDVNNRWDNWSPEFGYGDMSRILDQLMQSQMGEVNKMTDLGISRGQSDLAERQASQGVAGSSIKEAGNRAITNDANRNRSSLMQQLFQQNQQGKLGAMDSANRYDFLGTQQGTNVDLANVQNLLKKYNLMGSGYNSQLANVQNFDPTTLGDDFMALAGLTTKVLGLPGVLGS